MKDVRWLWKEHSDLHNYHRRYEEGVVPSIIARSFLPPGVDCSFPLKPVVPSLVNGRSFPLEPIALSLETHRSFLH